MRDLLLRRPRPGDPSRQLVMLLLEAAGAGLVAASAGIHLHLWADGYRSLPTIGPLVLLQGVTGAVLALALVGVRRPLVPLLAVVFAVATIAAFLLSTTVGLFGFTDTLGAPFAGLSLAVEAVAAADLAALLWLELTVLRESR